MGADQVIFTDPGLSAEIVRYEDLGADIRVRQTGETGAIIQDRAQKGRLHARPSPPPPVSRSDVTGSACARHSGPRRLSRCGLARIRRPSEQEPNDEPRRRDGGDLAGHRQRLARRARGRGRVSRARAGRPGSGGQDHRDADRIQRRHRRDVPRTRRRDAAAANDDFGPTRDSLAVYRPPADADVLVRVDRRQSQRRQAPLPPDARRRARRDLRVSSGPPCEPSRCRDR